MGYTFRIVVLIHTGNLFDTVKPRTRAYTPVLEALDRLHATRPPPPSVQSQPHAEGVWKSADDRAAWEGAGVALRLAECSNDRLLDV